MTHHQKNNIYYKIMVSSIYTAQNNGIMSDIWKLLSNFYISAAMSCNVFLLYILINNVFFPNSLAFLDVKWITIHKYNVLINMNIYALIPFMIMNFFFVFRNNKYKLLIKDYKRFYTKKVFVFYFSISILLPVFYVFLN